MDFQKIIGLIKTLEDGAVTPQEGADLIDAAVFVLTNLRPQFKKWYLRIVCDGVIVSLKELKEHLLELDHE